MRFEKRNFRSLTNEITTTAECGTQNVFKSKHSRMIALTGHLNDFFKECCKYKNHHRDSSKIFIITINA